MVELRVVNTSPLIYLSRAGMLDLLKAGDRPVIVPQAVVAEVSAWHTADEAQQAIGTLPWMKVASYEPLPDAVVAWDLGAGESAVLAYALAHPGHTVVVDDRAARRCATTLGIPLRGTLGLVLSAKQRGSLKSARDTLRRLRDAGMYLADSVVDAALREIGE